MAVTDDVSQSQNNKTDDQVYNIDIEKVYNDIIIEIDKIRSCANVQSDPQFKNMDRITNIDMSSANVSAIPQESRCHAFYRLIGFPVVATESTKYFTPGFDKINNNNTSINDNKQITAAQINKEMYALFDAREQIPRDFLSFFALQDVEAMVLAMSLREVRNFEAPFKNITSSFDTDLTHQEYTSELTNKLLSTVQNNGLHSTKLAGGSRKHILSPFVVDPRIEFSVTPKKNKLAVPFVKDKSELNLDNTNYLKRPYIEKVCLERFDDSSRLSGYGSYVQGIITSIQNNVEIKDDVLIKGAFKPNSFTSSSAQFAKYINVIRSMLNKLHEAVQDIQHVLNADPDAKDHALYNWTPIPNKLGPEKGCTTRDLLTGQINDQYNTKLDKELIKLLYAKTINNISSKINTVEKTDLGTFAFDSAFAFDNTEMTPDDNSSTSFGNEQERFLQEAQDRRKSYTDKANAAARIIEIIVGEFSGLGLCDILAISAALWIVEESTLLDLLDNTTIDRMVTNANLKSEAVTARQQRKEPDIKGALEKFSGTVQQMYQLINVLWRQISQENRK